MGKDYILWGDGRPWLIKEVTTPQEAIIAYACYFDDGFVTEEYEAKIRGFENAEEMITYHNSVAKYAKITALFALENNGVLYNKEVERL